MSINHSEYKGKTVDEAIVAACNELNVSREALKIEVISAGSAGIFGLGRKKAVIQVSLKSNPSEPLTGLPGSPPQKEAIPTPRQPREQGSTANGRAMPRGIPGRVVETRAKSDEASSAKVPPPEVLEEIKELTQNLLRLMGHPLEVTTSAKGNKVTAHIVAIGDPDLIIGRDGSILDAIQYLLRKIISQRYPEKIILALDAGNYREDRRKELEEQALEMARMVKETGRSQVMSALNPAERRIIHVTLQDDPAIRSSSIGEGVFKKVRIFLPGKGRKRSAGRTRGETVGPQRSTES